MKNKNKWIKVINILFLLIFVLFCNKENIIKLFSSIYSSFIRTVIDEKRYILFLNGLKSTLIISFLSIIIGTLFFSRYSIYLDEYLKLIIPLVTSILATIIIIIICIKIKMSKNSF